MSKTREQLLRAIEEAVDHAAYTGVRARWAATACAEAKCAAAQAALKSAWDALVATTRGPHEN
jgi:hypothetical protein